jgi:hypothetical protein
MPPQTYLRTEKRHKSAMNPLNSGSAAHTPSTPRRSGGADAPSSSCQAQERIYSLAAWLMKMFVFLRHEEKLGSADTQLGYHTQDGVGNGIVGGICRQIHLHTAAGASPRPTLDRRFSEVSHLHTNFCFSTQVSLGRCT